MDFYQKKNVFWYNIIKLNPENPNEIEIVGVCATLKEAQIIIEARMEAFCLNYVGKSQFIFQQITNPPKKEIDIGYQLKKLNEYTFEIRFKQLGSFISGPIVKKLAQFSICPILDSTNSDIILHDQKGNANYLHQNEIDLNNIYESFFHNFEQRKETASLIEKANHKYSPQIEIKFTTNTKTEEEIIDNLNNKIITKTQEKKEEVFEVPKFIKKENSYQRHNINPSLNDALLHAFETRYKHLKHTSFSSEDEN